jgi:hypothetical protein
MVDVANVQAITLPDDPMGMSPSELIGDEPGSLGFR